MKLNFINNCKSVFKKIISLYKFPLSNSAIGLYLLSTVFLVMCTHDLKILHNLDKLIEINSIGELSAYIQNYDMDGTSFNLDGEDILGYPANSTFKSVLLYNIDSALKARDDYYKSLYSLEASSNNLHDCILTHSCIPYIESRRDNFRASISYTDKNGNNIIPKYTDNITDLWMVLDNRILRDLKEYKSYLSEDTRDNIIFVSAPSNDVGSIEDIVYYYLYKDNYLYTIINKDRNTELFYKTSKNPLLTIEKSSRLEYRKYLELDNSTIRDIDVDQCTDYLYQPTLEAIDFAKFRFKDRYAASNIYDGEKHNNITFGIPIMISDYETMTEEGNESLYYGDIRQLDVPIYIDGYLKGFSGGLIDSWSLMECLHVLCKDNSADNPIVLVSVKDKTNFSIRNNNTQINVNGNNFQIIEGLEGLDTSLESDSNKYTTVNIKDDIDYEINRKYFDDLHSPIWVDDRYFRDHFK